MKTKNLFVLMIVLMFVLPSVIATNILTDNFYIKGTSTAVTNVQEVIFVCQDNDCVNVNQPEWVDTNSGGSNTISVTFPNNPSPVIYARYFYAPGYIPLEAKTTVWGTWADTGLDKYFDQKADCKAPVDSFIIQNEIYANEPMSVDVRAILDATTYSAFHDVGVPPYYVPDAYKDQYYSAQTTVTLNVYDSSNQLIYTENQAVNIYMDTAEDVQFTWVPGTQGDDYRAEITTDVTDAQCSSSQTVTTSQTFDVLPARPIDECYVLLNGLSLDDVTPEVNQNITSSYTKISNYADLASAKTAVEMQAGYTVRLGQSDPVGVIVFTSNELVGVTSTDTPSAVSFSWVPTTVGWHTVYVDGLSSTTGVCNGKTNHGESLVLETYVDPQPVHDVIFTVSDRDTGSRITGVIITSDGKTNTTVGNGVATLTGFVPGTYTYTASHANYEDKTGDIQIGTADLYVNIVLTQDNEDPFINLNSIDPMNINEGDSIVIDFNPLIFDPDNADSELTLSYTGDNIVSISIANNVVTFDTTVGQLGTETITFTVTDPDGASGSDTLAITVDDINQAPVITGLPDITLNEDASLFDAFNLYNYASDNELPDDQLIYTISNNNCGTTIDALNNVDIDPGLNFNGACTITVTVSDGEFTDNDDFIVTVNSVNDAPVIDSTAILLGYKGILYSYDVSAYDVENDTLTFSLLVNPAGMTIDVNTGVISWTPIVGQEGNNSVSVQVDDGNGGTDTQNFIIYVDPNSPPVITSTPITSATTHELYQYDVTATDADGDTLTYSLTVNPSFMTIDSSTGLIEWTPNNYDEGSHAVTVRVSDGNITVSQSYVLTVGEHAKPSEEDLMVANVRLITGDYTFPGDIVTLTIGLDNVGNLDLEDIKITALIPELGTWRRVGPFDLDENDEVNKRINLQIPSWANQGVYTIRITISNDKIRRIKHRDIVII